MIFCIGHVTAVSPSNHACMSSAMSRTITIPNTELNHWIQLESAPRHGSEDGGGGRLPSWIAAHVAFNVHDIHIVPSNVAD
jgi:hypothetical protein